MRRDFCDGLVSRCEAVPYTRDTPLGRKTDKKPKFRIVVAIECVGPIATSTISRHVEDVPGEDDPVAFKNAHDSYEALLWHLNTLEAFSE